MFPNIKQPKGKTALDGDVDISRVMASHLEMMAALLKKADQREAIMVDNLIAIRQSLDDMKMQSQSSWSGVSASLNKLSKIGMAILKVERLNSTGLHNAGQQHDSDQKKHAESKRSASAEKHNGRNQRDEFSNTQNQLPVKDTYREVHNGIQHQGERLAEIFGLEQMHGNGPELPLDQMTGMPQGAFPFSIPPGGLLPQVPPMFFHPGPLPSAVPPPQQQAQQMIQMMNAFAQQQYRQQYPPPHNLQQPHPFQLQQQPMQHHQPVHNVAAGLTNIFNAPPHIPMGAPHPPPFQGAPTMGPPPLNSHIPPPEAIGLSNLMFHASQNIPPTGTIPNPPPPDQGPAASLNPQEKDILDSDILQKKTAENGSITKPQSPNLLQSSVRLKLPQTNSTTEYDVPAAVPSSEAPATPKAGQLTD